MLCYIILCYAIICSVALIIRLFYHYLLSQGFAMSTRPTADGIVDPDSAEVDPNTTKGYKWRIVCLFVYLFTNLWT